MKKTITFFPTRAAMMLLAVMLTTATAWADNGYDYIDANGATRNTFTDDGIADANVTEINTSNKPTSLSGWCIVTENVTYTETILLTGNVNLILGDNTTLTINPTSGCGIYYNDDSPYSLTIWAQSSDASMGSLSARGNSGGYSAIGVNEFVLNGGHVTTSVGNVFTYDGDIIINGGFLESSIPYELNRSTINPHGSFTMNGGKVVATVPGSNGANAAAICAESGGRLTINGGQLEATVDGDGGAYGLMTCSQNTNITLGYTNASDYIKASSFRPYPNPSTSPSHVVIAEGKAMSDGTNKYTSTIDDPSVLNGKKLEPDPSVLFIVTFDANGYGTVAKFTQTVISGQKASKPATTWVGHTATWYNGSDEYDFNTPVTSNLTLTAQWTVNTYRVIFHNNCNDASGTMADQEFTYDVRQRLNANTYTRPGYGFIGWDDMFHVHSYSDRDDVLNLTTDQNGLHDLFAQWKAGTDINTCTAKVPDQTLGTYSTGIFYKFEAANSNATLAASMNIEVKDGSNMLTLGTDYEFGSVIFADNSLGMPDAVGDRCLVEIRGKGTYVGSKWVPFTITVDDAEGFWANFKWNFSQGVLSITGTGEMDAFEDYFSYPWFGKASYIKTINIGEGITSIAASAFACSGDPRYYGNVTTVNLPSTLKTIGKSAFAYCSGLVDVTIPYGVTTINNTAFEYCSSLTSIIIPASVTSIGSDAFFGCTNISDVYCYVTDPSALTWTDGDCNDFKAVKASTTCHVFNKTAFDTKWATDNEDVDVCVTFVGDLANVPFSLTEVEGVSHLEALAGKTLPVQFKRTFDTNTSGTGKASTVCLPFAFAKPDKTTVGTFYTFGGVDNTSGEYVVTMNEETATTLTVGKPYLFKPVAGSELTFGNASFTVPASITAGMTDVGGWQFTGTFTKKTWPSGQTRLYGFAAADFTTSGGQIASSDVGSFRSYNSGYCDAFRCYLWAPAPSPARRMNQASGSLPSTLKVVLVSANGETTGIGMLDTRTGEVTFGDEWYSLDGTKLSGEPTKKGVYIHKGNKVAIK